MLPPNVAEFAESFIGFSIYGMLDLYSGFHHRLIHEDSHPLTACQMPKGSVLLTSLPMGYTNSMQEFQRTTAHIIEPLGPKKANNFVDDVSVKGPESRYGDRPIQENPNICRFMWEYAHTLYACLWLLAEGGATTSGRKLHLVTPRVSAVGYECNIHGIKPHHGIISKVMKWPTPRDVKGVRGFLGTVGITRNWIKNYARLAKPLTDLTRLQPHEFIWPAEAQQAFNVIKVKVTEVTVLKKLNIEMAKRAILSNPPRKPNEGQVILAVDTSWIAVGFVLYQVFRNDDADLRPADGKPLSSTKATALIRHPIRFGSITLNQVESRYSQPKRELFGLFRALKALEHMLWGLPVLIEADASFLKAMVNSPELPNAAATRWIVYIHLFDLKYKHVPAENHVAPDGLSCHPQADDDTDNTDLGDNFNTSGPFIKVSAMDASPLEPREFYLECTAEDTALVDITKLRAWHGEPENPVRRYTRNEATTLHLACIEQPISSADSITCTFMTLVTCPRLIYVDSMVAANQLIVGKGQGESSYPSAVKNSPKPSTINQMDNTLQRHDHHILDFEDHDKYWNNIILYLRTFQVPKSINKGKSFIQTTRKYFLYEDMLWRQTGDNAIPHQVILDTRHREEIVRQAHEDSGHRGRDPTYKKILDFYFWPNMFAHVALFC